MNDGTRAPSGDVAQPSRLGGLAWFGLVSRVEDVRAEGQALLTLVAHWGASAHGLIAELEAELATEVLSDEAFLAVSRLLGLDGLQALAEEIVASCDPNITLR